MDFTKKGIKRENAPTSAPPTPKANFCGILTVCSVELTLSRGETGVCLLITGEIGDIGARISVLCSSEHRLFS